MRRWHIVTLIVAVAVVAVACGGGASEPARPPTTVPIPTATTIPLVDFGAGLIAFVSDREGNPEIFVMNPDGSGIVRLTDIDSVEADPAWSSDGSKLAFASDRGFDPVTSQLLQYPEGTKFATSLHGGIDIYVMDADGTNVVQLTDSNPADDLAPSWSPDGTKIIFMSDRETSDNSPMAPTDIFVMNTDGSDLAKLTSDTLGGNFEPKWSPSGEKIAFSSDRDDDVEIFVMNTDGSNAIQLTENSAADFQPAWSPDGSKIAFTSMRDGNLEIYSMNADGTGATRLTDTPASVVDVQATWSPDGTKIAFSSNRDGNLEIYVMNADGSNVTRITDGPGFNSSPRWNGKR